MWIRDIWRRLHLDFHMPEWSPEVLTGFDAAQIVENVLRSQADALCFFAKCHYGNAYYRAAIGHRHRNMGGRDFFGEVLEQCGRRGLPLVAYFSLVWYQHASLNHPDWCMRDPQGRPVIHPWPYLCFNSPYRDYTAQMVRELAGFYRFVGIHFDMINFSFNGLSCYCERCRAEFYNQSGCRIPEQPSWDETWAEFLGFRSRTILRFVDAVRAAAGAAQP